MCDRIAQIFAGWDRALARRLQAAPEGIDPKGKVGFSSHPASGLPLDLTTMTMGIRSVFPFLSLTNQAAVFIFMGLRLLRFNLPSMWLSFGFDFA